MKRPSLTLLRRAVYLATGTRRWPWAAVIVLALLVSTVEALGAGAIFGLLGLLAEPGAALELPLVGDVRPRLGGSDDRTVLVNAAIGVATFFAVRAVVVVTASYVQARVTQSAGARLAARLHRGYLAMPYVTYGRANSAELIRNAHDAVQRVVIDVFVQGARLVSESVVVLVLATVLLLTSPLALLLLVGVLAPTILVLDRVIQPRLARLGAQTQHLIGVNLKVLQESLHGLRELRVVGREGYFADRFASARAELARNRVQRFVLQDVPTAALETAFAVFITGFLLVTVSSGRPAADVLPVLGMFAYVGLRLKPSLNGIVQAVNGLRFAGAAVDDLYEDLRRAEAWLTASADDGAREVRLTRDVVLERVTFCYPGAPTPALDDVSLTIRRGTSVGLVGATGGGKSTLVDVLIGLLEPQAGQVLVDGRSVSGARRSWTQRLGVVSQAPFLVDDTIRRNIALGEPDHDVDEARLAAAVESAQLGPVLERLPAGLDTPVGERGVRLSGGQRQRVAIARALYREPELLVLDEGTSALDNRTEASLMAAVDRLRGKYTVLLVAHRLSTVQRCDQICVVDAGRIVARGTYEELLRDSAAFRDLAI